MDFGTILNWLKVGVVFITMISLLVAAHEYGHYLFARIFGMGVEEFAIGFGKPKLVTWLRRKYEVDLTPEQAEQQGASKVQEETEFTIRPWPLGGFVRINGMSPHDDGSEVNIPGGFYSRAPWKRFIVLLAGPAFSVLAGVILLFGIYLGFGDQRPIAIVDSTKEGYPAHGVLLKGDRVMAIDGKTLELPWDVAKKVREGKGAPVRLTLKRGDSTIDVNLIPKLGVAGAPPLIGLQLKPGAYESVSVGPAGALALALQAPVDTVIGLKKMVTREVAVSDSVGGPISVVQVTNSAVQTGALEVIKIAALLSISLGIFNLLPIGMLDGGQMMLALIEELNGRKRLSLKFQEAYFTAGMFAILCMFIGVIVVDMRRVTAPKPPPVSTPAPPNK